MRHPPYDTPEIALLFRLKHIHTHIHDKQQPPAYYVDTRRGIYVMICGAGQPERMQRARSLSDAARAFFHIYIH